MRRISFVHSGDGSIAHGNANEKQSFIPAFTSNSMIFCIRSFTRASAGLDNHSSQVQLNCDGVDVHTSVVLQVQKEIRLLDRATRQDAQRCRSCNHHSAWQNL
jgi:hypothetical protein